MTVPLIQGLLKYAFKADPANPNGSCQPSSADSGAPDRRLTYANECPKEWGEGWAFAAAALPRIDFCDPDVAATVRANLDVAHDAPMVDGFQTVKAQLETTYDCMGITCADVGELQASDGSVYAGMAMCTGDDIVKATILTTRTDSKKSEDVNMLPLVVIIVVSIVLLLVSIFFFVKWRKTETVLFELIAKGKETSTAII